MASPTSPFTMATAPPRTSACSPTPGSGSPRTRSSSARAMRPVTAWTCTFARSGLSATYSHIRTPRYGRARSLVTGCGGPNCRPNAALTSSAVSSAAASNSVPLPPGPVLTRDGAAAGSGGGVAPLTAPLVPASSALTGAEGAAATARSRWACSSTARQNPRGQCHPGTTPPTATADEVGARADHAVHGGAAHGGAAHGGHAAPQRYADRHHREHDPSHRTHSHRTPDRHAAIDPHCGERRSPDDRGSSGDGGAERRIVALLA